MKAKEIQDIARKLSGIYGIHLTKSEVFNKLSVIDQHKVRDRVYRMNLNTLIG